MCLYVRGTGNPLGQGSEAGAVRQSEVDPAGQASKEAPSRHMASAGPGAAGLAGSASGSGLYNRTSDRDKASSSGADQLPKDMNNMKIRDDKNDQGDEKICRALAYIHSGIGVCHRDIKPQNLLVCISLAPAGCSFARRASARPLVSAGYTTVLSRWSAAASPQVHLVVLDALDSSSVNPHTHQLKLCDFGSAKVLVDALHARLIRRLTAVLRTHVPKFWGLALAIFAGKFANLSAQNESAAAMDYPLFPGESGVDQLVEIIKVLGTPTREEIKCMNPNYTEFKFPQIKAHPWHKVFHKRMPPEAVDLVSRLLQYSPNLRCSALEACVHPFFDELRDPNTRLPNGKALPLLFNFKKEELKGASADVLQRLIPEHARKQNAHLLGASASA
eukprot:jgi/Mesen1/5976/ME000302S04975